MAINYFGANIFQVYISTSAMPFFQTLQFSHAEKIKINFFFVAASKIHLRKLCLDNNFSEAEILLFFTSYLLVVSHGKFTFKSVWIKGDTEMDR